MCMCTSSNGSSEPSYLPCCRFFAPAAAPLPFRRPAPYAPRPALLAPRPAPRAPRPALCASRPAPRALRFSPFPINDLPINPCRFTINALSPFPPFTDYRSPAPHRSPALPSVPDALRNLIFDPIHGIFNPFARKADVGALFVN